MSRGSSWPQVGRWRKARRRSREGAAGERVWPVRGVVLQAQGLWGLPKGLGAAGPGGSPGQDSLGRGVISVCVGGRYRRPRGGQ